MKKLLLIIGLTFSLTSCNTVAVGEVRIFCKDCNETINPYQHKEDEVVVIDAEGHYVQYTNMKGDTLNCSIEEFNDNTYQHGLRVGNDNGGGEIVILFLFILMLVILL